MSARLAGADSPTGKSLSCSVILFSSNIVSDSSTNEILQSRLINCITLMKIDRSHRFRIKASIKESIWIIKERALKKVHFHYFLESAESTDKSMVRPYRGRPLPLLSD